MHNPYTPELAFQRIGKERTQLLLRLGHSETVQVNLGLDLILPTPQLAQDPVLDALPREDELFAAGEVRVGSVIAQALLKHSEAIGSREAGPRQWWAASFGGWNVLWQRLDVLDGFTK